MPLRRLTLLAGFAFAAEILCAASAAADEFSSAVQSRWHLAVVDAELVAGSRSASARPQLRSISVRDERLLAGAPRAEWSLQLGMVRPPHVFRTSFGPTNGTPIAGDFNGDGLGEMALFVDGRWYVDFNGNSAWDADDLLVTFGSAGDQPIVGDWNGDGKDDFGVVRRPGDVMLAAGSTAVPSRKGACFAFGPAAGTPVVGDWSNTGVERIGVYADGVWTLDVDGDRRFTQADAVVRLGAPGDQPIVGDFNRDGRDDLGVYRRGVWQIDTTGDLRFSDDDLSYRLGDDDDTPVVGDWDGDGRDQIGVVHRAANGSRPPSVR